jgi:hypothetical protein
VMVPTEPFGKAIAQSVVVIPVWMSVVLSSRSYKSRMYADGIRDELQKPFGRPSSISVCEHTDDFTWM